MRPLTFIITGVVVAAALAALFVAPLFLPEDSVHLEQAMPPGSTGDGGATDGASTVRGEDGHRASGTVRVVATGDGNYLRFEDLDITAGPDLYLYLIDSAGSSGDKIAAGLRVTVVTEQDPSGKINERGTFNVRLPDGVKVADYGGISVWCDRFGVPFATAPLG